MANVAPDRSPTLVHCSYHKCLTVFANRCFSATLGEAYRSFSGPLDAFYAQHRHFAVSATSDFAVDVTRLDDFRISRFVRDPRDLLVSGYHYHRKGIEAWTTRLVPTAESWRATGARPAALQDGESYADCLRRISVEDGLIAEMEFRAPHFCSMLAWPADARIRVWKYEDILGREGETMDEVVAHYGWEPSDPRRITVRQEGERWRAGDGRLAWDAHVRDPRAGQWRDLFTPAVARAFTARFPTLIADLGYAAA